jgi:hypothetical protein
MKIKLTSREYSERLARERGIPIAPPDHPIYKEGPTFILLSEKPERYCRASSSKAVKQLSSVP